MTTGSSAPLKTWKTKVARRLVASTDASNVEDAVCRYTARLRRRALADGLTVGVGEPPYDPSAFARVLGVEQVTTCDLACDGQIRVDDISGSLIIEVDSTSVSKGRRRFTVAHEVGHLILWEVCGGLRKRAEKRGAGLRATEVERLCDKLAGELLCPSVEVHALLRAQQAAGPRRNLVAILQLAKRYDVSLQFAAIRLREVCGLATGIALIDVARRQFDWHLGLPAPLKAWEAIEDWTTRHPEAVQGGGSYSEFGKAGMRTHPFWLRKLGADRLMFACDR